MNAMHKALLFAAAAILCVVITIWSVPAILQAPLFSTTLPADETVSLGVFASPGGTWQLEVTYTRCALGNDYLCVYRVAGNERRLIHCGNPPQDMGLSWLTEDVAVIGDTRLDLREGGQQP